MQHFIPLKMKNSLFRCYFSSGKKMIPSGRVGILLLTTIVHILFLLHVKSARYIDPKKNATHFAQRMILVSVISNKAKELMERPPEKSIHFSIRQKKIVVASSLKIDEKSKLQSNAENHFDELPNPKVSDNGKLDLGRLRNDFIKSESARGSFVDAKAELPAETIETKFAKGTKRAIREDCRKAYASTGLLAIPQLAKDMLTDKGCKW